jgi:sporulation protein YlmC with PRC-barrel domain
MRCSIFTAGVASALLLFQASAMAQTNTPEHVRDLLQKQGFKDIQVVPESFIIHAKDKDGDPVVMSVSPDSITMVKIVGGPGSDGSADDTTTHKDSNEAAHYVPVPNNDALSSNLIGLDVYNNSNQNVGQIKDIALNPRGRADAFILSVGGFLGLGTHYVAVNPADVKVTYNDSDKKWHATMNATADELKAAPEFKYSGRWYASKS